MDGKVLKIETIDKLAKLIDEAKKWKNIFIESVDGFLAKQSIKFIDAWADKKIPDKFDADINLAVDYIFEEKYEDAAGKAGEILDELIDLEKVDDDQERLIFVDGAKFITRIILNVAQKKQKEANNGE